MLGKVQGTEEYGEGEGPMFGDALGSRENKGTGDEEEARNSPDLDKGSGETWGERKRIDGSAGASIGKTGPRMGGGAGHTDGDGEEAVEVHRGLGESVSEARSGMRRADASHTFDKEERCSKDGPLERIRVDRFKVLERKDYGFHGFSDGGSFVYCIETEGNHNFFANGILAHNCNNVPYETFDQLEVRTKEYVFLDWNPVSEFWFYTEVQGKRDDTEFITLTYRDNESLDPAIVASIEQRRGNAQWWKVYGEGLLGESEGKIYRDWRIIDELPHEARLERYGLDFGYTNDPTAVAALYACDGGFIIDEVLFQKGMSNRQIADRLLALPKATVVCDSAEPKSIDELCSYGLWAVGSLKGPGSVCKGIQYVQDQRISVTKRSVNAIKEYRNYLWAVDRNGRPLNVPEPGFDHMMDAVRYALESYRPKVYDPEPAVFVPPSYL